MLGWEPLQISKKKKEGKEKLSRFAVLGRESLQNKVFSRLSLHPIHVLVEWVALAFTSRDPVCGKIKFWSSFFKSLWFPKAKPLVAMSRFCFVYAIGFVLRDPKLNYVQLPGFVEKRAKYLIVRRLCGWILKAENQFSKEGAFVREKPPR